MWLLRRYVRLVHCTAVQCNIVKDTERVYTIRECLQADKNRIISTRVKNIINNYIIFYMSALLGMCTGSEKTQGCNICGCDRWFNTISPPGCH